jgi:transposase
LIGRFYSAVRSTMRFSGQDPGGGRVRGRGHGESVTHPGFVIGALGTPAGELLQTRWAEAVARISTIAPGIRGVGDHAGVAPNFVAADRDQLLLMPPSVAEWLPEDHLAWFVLDVVAELDLVEFVAAYRPDGRGGAAYDPAMMVGLLVYAYCVGERSSRGIQRRCVEDVAFRVVAANQGPDHATIARFRATHQEALAGLFGQVLGLCERAGMIRPGLLAIDGTKMAADASRDANRTTEQLAREILDEAAAVDAAEDAEHGDASGAELPEAMAPKGRRAKLRALLDELESEAAAKSYDTHLERRAEQEAATGRPIRGRRPKPGSATHRSRRHANTTDPDSRLLKTKGGFVQGYNAQAVATTDQVVVAASVTNGANDATAFAPVLNEAKVNLRRAGSRRRVQTVVADAGYWSNDNAATTGIEAIIAPGKARELDQITADDHARTEVLDAVEHGQLTKTEAAERLGVTRTRVNQLLRKRRTGSPATLTTVMVAKLATPRGQRLYRRRAAAIEPVFAQVKHNRGFRSFARRGLAAVDSEWKLIAASHNLLKLWRHPAHA